MTSGTVTDQTPATRMTVRAKVAITIISVGINMIAPIYDRQRFATSADLE
jgi:hypothetical protein